MNKLSKSGVICCSAVLTVVSTMYDGSIRPKAVIHTLEIKP